VTTEPCVDSESWLRELDIFSMGSGMTQEVFMNWDQIKTGWRRLKDKIALRRDRLRDDRSSVDFIDSAALREGESRDTQTTAFCPDDHARQSEFSLHIGC
jgi:hypothetical protein